MPWGLASIVLIILGVVLFAAGWATGSRGGRVYFDRGIRVVSHSQDDTSQERVDLNFSNRFTSIQATAGSRNITFVPTNEPNVRVTSNYRRDLETSEQGGRLYVNARSQTNINFMGSNRRWSFMSFGSQGISWNRVDGTNFLDFNFDFNNFSLSSLNDTIRIYVPSGVNDIYGRVNSGNVHAYNINTTELSLRANSGRVSVEGGTHTNAHLQTTSGTVRGDAFFSDLYARTTSGNVNITDRSTSHNSPQGGIQLRATSGNVNFTTNAPISHFRYNLSISSGNMRVDGNRYSGRRTSGGNGATQIDASTTSGNVRLDFGR